MFAFWIKFHLNLFIGGPIGKSVLIPIVTCCQTGGKPLPEPMLTNIQIALLGHIELIR